jgi:hypothetical protein
MMQHAVWVFHHHAKLGDHVVGLSRIAVGARHHPVGVMHCAVGWLTAHLGPEQFPASYHETVLRSAFPTWDWLCLEFSLRGARFMLNVPKRWEGY